MIARERTWEDEGQHTQETGEPSAEEEKGTSRMVMGDPGMQTRQQARRLSRWAGPEEAGEGLQAEEADVSDHMERTHTLLGKVASN